MKGTNRKIWAAGIAGVLVASVGLVSNPVVAASKTTINFFTFTAVPDHMKDLQAMVAVFEKKNPTIHINIQSAPYADYFNKLKTRVAGNQIPDTFELDYDNVVTYAAAGTLLDLNKASSKDHSFNKSAYYGKAYDTFNIGGKQVGVPSSFSTVVLFYNKDLFKQAGVALPTSKWDWSDEAAAAAKLKANLPAGTYADFQPTQYWEFYKVLGQAGGQFLSADKKTATFNKQPGINALNWLVSKTQNGWSPTKAQMGTLADDAMFKAGKIAMYHSGVWQFKPFSDAPFSWDIAVEPGGVTPGNHFFANAVVASAKTKYPYAAWKWAQFMTSNPAAIKIRLAASWEIPAISDKKALATYLSLDHPANRQAVFDALKNPVTPPVVRQANELHDIVNGWLEKALNGSVSVTEALNSAASDVNALLAKE